MWQKHQQLLNKKLLPLLYIAIALLVILLVAPHKARAVTASDWHAGHIIDDSVFFNKDSMTVGQIQEFLNAKVPTCNRWHTTSNTANQPPYTCLKEYQENPSTHQNNYGQFNSDGSPASVPGGLSAAQIIWNVGQEFGINSQTLIVVLQKEQALVTDDWPWYGQYQKAMGYACPDTAACDSTYFGFYNQVYNAAKQFTKYAANPYSYNYPAYTTRYIQYNPDTNCGGSNVYIENQATSNLYNYTPYQPNQYSLNGGSVSDYPYCGAFGNRNFWTYFNNWFGSTNAGDTQVQLVSDLSITPSEKIIANDSIHARFTLRNNTGTPVYVGGMSVAVRRLSDNANFDYALVNVTVPAYGTYTYDQAQSLPTGGQYSFEIVNYRSSVGWSNNYPYSLYNTLIRKWSSLTVQPAVILSTGVNLSTSTLVPGKNTTASFQITNPNSTPVSLGTLALAGRDPQGNNVDFVADSDVTIPANSTYTYSKTRSFSSLGQYNLYIVNYRGGIGWNTLTPPSANSSILRSLTPTVKPNPRIISSLSVNPTNPVAGQNTTVSFQIRNDADTAVNVGLMAVAARDPQGKNVDFAPDTNVTIPANSTYTYSKTQAFAQAGNYNFNIVNYRDGYGWSSSYPVTDNGVNTSKIQILGANPAVTSSLSATPADTIAGKTVSVSFDIRNDAEVPVNIGSMAVAARDPQGKNVDFALTSNITIQPHTTYTYSSSQVLMNSGQYSFSIVNYRDGYGWSSSYPLSSSTSITRSITKNVGSNPVITSGLTLVPNAPAVGQSATASFTVTNNGEVPMNIGGVAVTVRGPQGQNYDYGLTPDIIIAPGATYTYSQSQAFPITGPYTFTIVDYKNTSGWTSGYPASLDPSIIRSLTTTVKPNPRIISSLSVNPTNPVAGQNTTVSFQIRNDADTAVNVGLMAVAARDPQGKNVDFAPDTNVTIPANSTYTYSKTQAFAQAGNYNFNIVNYRDGYGWSSSYPVTDNGSIVITKSITVSQ